MGLGVKRMNKIYYPTLDTNFLATLDLLAKAYIQDPEFHESNYSDSVKNSLAVSITNLSTILEDTEEDDIADFGEKQIVAMLKKLNHIAKDKSLDSKEHANIIKIQAQLTERLTVLLERTVNIKKMNDFQIRILTFMDGFLSDEQKEILADSLKDI